MVIGKFTLALFHTDQDFAARRKYPCDTPKDLGHPIVREVNQRTDKKDCVGGEGRKIEDFKIPFNYRAI